MDPAKKKRVILIGSLVALALAAAATLGVLLTTTGAVGSPMPLTNADKVLKVGWRPQPPEIFYSPLSGLEQSAAAYLRRPLVVKVENEPPARPQTGLDRADVVYEVPMEGYDVTRFAAVYQSRDAATIGPIRSARLSDAVILPQYNGMLAHCGGIYQVLDIIKRAHIVDLDQYFNEPSYWRAGHRSAPHNLYTSTSRLWRLAKSKGAYRPVHLPSLGFKDDEKRGSGGRSISIPFGDLTHVRWAYNPAQNAYGRYQEGAPHSDAVTGRQLMAKNLILMRARERVTNYVEDVQGSRSLEYDLVGSGKAAVFIDGRRIDGKWTATKKRPPVFTDSAGKRILLNRGPVWIEVVPARINVTIQ